VRKRGVVRMKRQWDKCHEPVSSCSSRSLTR
jgi:hypothetical protein